MNLHNACPGIFHREREFDLAVQATGTEEGGIQRIHAVGSGNYLHSGEQSPDD